MNKLLAIGVVLILIVGIIGTVYLTQRQTQLKSKAFFTNYDPQLCQTDCRNCQKAQTCGNETYDSCDTNPCQAAGATATTTFKCHSPDNPNCEGTYYCGMCSTPSCKTTTICGQSVTGNSPSDCTFQCVNGKAQYNCVQSDNSNCQGTILCAPEDYKCSPSGGTPQGSTGVLDAAECKSVVFKKDGQSAPSLFENQKYDVEITMDNKDYNNPSYQGPTWTVGNLPAGTGYFLGFPTCDNSVNPPKCDSGAGNFLVNKDTSGSGLSINSLWQINWPDPTKLRIPLGTNVPAGGSNTFKFTVTPQKAGTHTFYWSMVHEGVNWFGGQCTPDISVAAAAGGIPPPGETVTPSPAPGTPTIQYRIAEGERDIDARNNLGSASYQVYSPGTTGSVIRKHTFSGIKPGDVRHLAVQFKKGDIESPAFVTKLIKFVGITPAITNVKCNYTQTGDGTSLTITGANFARVQGKGQVTANNKLVGNILSWADNQITVLVKELLEGIIPVKVTNDQGLVSEGGSCIVNVTTVEFSAKLQCKTTNFAAQNVNVKIYERIPTANPDAPFFKQTIQLDQNGRPQADFKPKLEVGKPYSVLIKAPNSLAKLFEFIALEGTTVINQPILLLVGDIAPAGFQDGVINSVDLSELIRQWSLVQDVTRAADFNSDKRVNSFDYSCIRENIRLNQKDDVFIPQSPTPSPSPSPQPSTSQI